MADHQVTITEDGSSQKTIKAYVVGFVLSIILTIIPFTLVAKRLLSSDSLYTALVVCAILQLLVQVIFFLRLNVSPKGRWNLMAFLFTVMVVLILVFGSLWIMYNLNYNMAH